MFFLFFQALNKGKVNKDGAALNKHRTIKDTFSLSDRQATLTQDNEILCFMSNVFSKIGLKMVEELESLQPFGANK